MKLILISGENSFLCQRKLNEILEKEKGTLVVLESVKFQEVLEKVKSQDLFSKKMILVAKNCFKEKSFENDFEVKKEKLLIPQNKVLIFFEPEGKIKKSLIDFFKKEGEVFLFQNLTKKELKKWLKEEFLKYEKKVEERVLEKMIELGGNDLWFLAEEVKKLSLFKNDEKIELTDLEKVFYPNFEFTIFQFLDKIFSGKKKEGLILLNHLFQKEKDFQFIFSMIIFYLRGLILVKSGKKSSFHPFLLEKLKILEKRYTLETLKKIYKKIGEGEILIKQGKIDPKLFLEDLVIFGI